MSYPSGKDCATETNSFVKGLCYAANNNTFDLNGVKGYKTLPLCVTSFIGYGLLENIDCAIAGGGTQTAYASCFCSTSFSDRLYSVNSTVENLCGAQTPVASSLVLSVAEAYCMSMAGGFILADATTTRTAISTVPAASMSSSRHFPSSTALISSITSSGNNSAPAATSPLSSTRHSSHSSLGGGAIAGIVIGGLALLTFWAVLVWFLHNRRKMAKGPKAEAEEAGVVGPKKEIDPDEIVPVSEKVAPVEEVPSEKKDVSGDSEFITVAEPPPAYEMHRFFARFHTAAGVDRTESNRQEQ